MMSRSLSIKILKVALLLALTASAIVRPAWAQTSGYRLPWIYCHWQKVLQGWGGSYSHNNTQMWYAYDFSHPEGAPVRAAKSGYVAFARAGETRCGGPEYANLANYVTIYHPDNTATLYLHLKDVYVAVGQSVSRGQTIGTAGKTGWTGCNPHLHFQRQDRGGWITTSKPIYFDEYPNQQLQQGEWYQSQNYWPGDRCPTRAEAGLGCGGIIGAGVGKVVRRRKSIRAILIGIVPALLIVGLLSGCGPSGKGDTSLPGNPPAALGPDKPVGVMTPSPVPTAVEPPLPTPLSVPTPQPILLPSDGETKRLTGDWKVFDNPDLGILFRYPPDYLVHVVEDRGWTTLDITRPIKDPIWGTIQETFLSLFLWKHKGTPIATSEELLKWVSSLPPEMNPVGGDFIVMGNVVLPHAKKAWTARWEPLPGNDEVVVDSIVIPTVARIVWVNLGDPTRKDREEIWPLQMAFLATLEVTE